MHGRRGLAAARGLPLGARPLALSGIDEDLPVGVRVITIIISISRIMIITCIMFIVIAGAETRAERRRDGQANDVAYNNDDNDNTTTTNNNVNNDNNVYV